MASSTVASTRNKLLAAAEEIVVVQGIKGVSVRKVGEVAGVNATLVTYHFGSLGNLLDELCALNLEPIRTQWAKIGASGGDCDLGGEEGDFDALLRLWLAPMLNASAFTKGGRALVVLDEIAAHGEGALTQSVLDEMLGFSQSLRLQVAPHTPHLDDDELRARLRFISGAVLGPPPRSGGAPVLADGRTLDDLDYLVRFARAALSG